LRGTYGNRRKYSWGTLKEKSAHAVGKEAANPRSKIFVGPFSPQRRRELAGVDIVKAALDVQEKRGDLGTKSLEEANLMGESRSGVESGETREGSRLVRVKQAHMPGQEGET